MLVPGTQLVPQEAGSGERLQTTKDHEAWWRTFAAQHGLAPHALVLGPAGLDLHFSQLKVGQGGSHS